MKSSLLKLKSLVDDLTDRDLRLKEETKLLDYVFSDFPIPILVWSVDLDGEIKALRGNSILNPSAECEDQLFKDKKARKALEECKKDSKNPDLDNSYRLFDTGGKVYYMSVTRRFAQSGKEIGYIGMAWDISSNALMLKNMQAILIEAVDGDCSKEKITELASEAVKNSKLMRLIVGERKDG